MKQQITLGHYSIMRLKIHKTASNKHKFILLTWCLNRSAQKAIRLNLFVEDLMPSYKNSKTGQPSKYWVLLTIQKKKKEVEWTWKDFF